MILLFGSDKCKFCKIQSQMLEETFENDWTYINFLNGKDELDITYNLDINDIPTVIVIDESNKEIYRKSGLTAPDRLFKIINFNNKNLFPTDKECLNNIKAEKTKSIILSYDPLLKMGQKILISDYLLSDKIKAKVLEVNKINLEIDKTSNCKKFYRYSGKQKFGFAIFFDWM